MEEAGEGAVIGAIGRIIPEGGCIMFPEDGPVAAPLDLKNAIKSLISWKT